MPIGTEFAALFERDLLRLAQEVRAFPNDEALWRTIPGVSNCAGNLTLHLEGNLLDYIGRQLGGITYTRRRPEEFGLKGVPLEELHRRAEALHSQIPPVLANLADAQWEALYPENVLGQPMTTRQFVLHLHGHFNYHLGQIDYLRRALTGNPALPLAGLAAR